MEKIITDKALILKPKNDLVASNISELLDEIKDLIHKEFTISIIVIDLSNTKIIDSMGISFLINLYKITIHNNKTFEVRKVSEDIKKLFNLMKLDAVFGT